MATRPPYRQTFFRLLGFLKPYKVSLIVSILLAVGSQAAAMVIAYLTATALAQAIDAKSHTELYAVAGLVLVEAYTALKPGGLLAVEMNHRDNLLGRYLAEVVTEREGNRMIDRHRYDVQTSRSHDERTIVRGGKTRTFEFSVRMFTAAELRDWLFQAGFEEAHAFGEDGEPLTLEHRRMTVVARK